MCLMMQRGRAEQIPGSQVELACYSPQERFFTWPLGCGEGHVPSNDAILQMSNFPIGNVIIQYYPYLQ